MLRYGFPVALVLSFALAALGCGGESEPGPPGTSGGEPGGCPAGEWKREDGSCVPAGLPPDMPCPPSEWLRDDGSCIPAGVPPDGCGEGFVHDGDRGCDPILPAEPCPEGLMAVPGDTACREVAACGSGTWGDIPVEGDTEHVDASYAGGNSDGSALDPWTSIQEAVDAAAPGAIVAVAAGSYVEGVIIEGKPVRLWGRCPAIVEIVGTGTELAAVFIRAGADATEVRSLAMTGDSIGLALSGSENVVVDRVWVHETASRGINVQNDLGPTAISVTGSLVEQSHKLAVFVAGSMAGVEATVIRDTLPDAQGWGRGVNAQLSPDTGAPSTLTMNNSVVEQSRQLGVFVGASVASVEATVIRDTLPDAEGIGQGVSAVDDPNTGAPSALVLNGSLVERSHETGLFVQGSVAIVEATVIRDTLPDAQGRGRGVNTQHNPGRGAPSYLTLRSSLVDHNREVGVQVSGSVAIVEATVIRDTLPNGLGRGRGVNTQQDSALTLTSSLVEQSRELGVHVAGSVATVEATVIRDTLPGAMGRGRGVNAQRALDTGAPSTLTLISVLIERSIGTGVMVFGPGAATIDRCLVRDTVPDPDGALGDGIVVFSHRGPASATITGTRVANSARAAISSLGADVAIGGSLLSCQVFDLAGNPFLDFGYAYHTVGDNLCGCPEADGECIIDSAAMEAPEPVGGLE